MSNRVIVIPANHQPLKITATEKGTRQRCGTDRFGFPIRHSNGQKTYFGFRTGDLVTAKVTTGKKQGTYTGRLAVRATGSFKITTAAGAMDGINHRFFRLLQRGDGYAYH